MNTIKAILNDYFNIRSLLWSLIPFYISIALLTGTAEVLVHADRGDPLQPLPGHPDELRLLGGLRRPPSLPPDGNFVITGVGLQPRPPSSGLPLPLLFLLLG